MFSIFLGGAYDLKQTSSTDMISWEHLCATECKGPKSAMIDCNSKREGRLWEYDLAEHDKLKQRLRRYNHCFSPPSLIRSSPFNPLLLPLSCKLPSQSQSQSLSFSLSLYLSLSLSPSSSLSFSFPSFPVFLADACTHLTVLLRIFEEVSLRIGESPA